MPKKRQPPKPINVAAKALSDPAYRKQVVPDKRAAANRKLGREKPSAEDE